MILGMRQKNISLRIWPSKYETNKFLREKPEQHYMRFETKNFERQLALQRKCTASAGLARLFPIIIVTILVVSVVVIISVIIKLIVITMAMATLMIVISWDFNNRTASAGLARVSP